MQSTIDGCGQVTFEFASLKGFGGEATKKFLVKTIKNSIVRASSYCMSSDINDHIDSYSEQPLHSVICPAISDVTNGKFIFEHPLKRKWYGEDPYTGHIDYWASFLGKSYIVEIKHSYLSYQKKQPVTNTITKLEDAVRQLNGVKNTFRRDYPGNDMHYYGIAFEWVTFRKGSTIEEKLEMDDTKEIKDAYASLKQVVGSVQLYGLWMLEDTLLTPVRYNWKKNKTKYVQYPAVAFIVSMPY
jgi:hypothetical protein